MGKKSSKPFKKAYLEITNVCNLNCSFCPKTKRSPRFITTEEFLHLIDEVTPFTDYVYFHLMGEPLLHPKLKEFFTICGERGLKVSLTTNGPLLKKNRTSCFLPHPCTGSAFRSTALKQIRPDKRLRNTYRISCSFVPLLLNRPKPTAYFVSGTKTVLF